MFSFIRSKSLYIIFLLIGLNVLSCIIKGSIGLPIYVILIILAFNSVPYIVSYVFFHIRHITGRNKYGVYICLLLSFIFIFINLLSNDDTNGYTGFSLFFSCCSITHLFFIRFLNLQEEQ
jgi:hypothetical protein